MKDKDGWFTMRGWNYSLREHPDWETKFPTGPVHWDIRWDDGHVTEQVSAKDLTATRKRGNPKLAALCNRITKST